MKNSLYGSLIMKVIFTVENDTSHKGRRAVVRRPAAGADA
jgi:hypothetical protein